MMKILLSTQIIVFGMNFLIVITGKYFNCVCVVLACDRQRQTDRQTDRKYSCTVNERTQYQHLYTLACLHPLNRCLQTQTGDINSSQTSRNIFVCETKAVDVAIFTPGLFFFALTHFRLNVTACVLNLSQYTFDKCLKKNRLKGHIARHLVQQPSSVFDKPSLP